MCGWWGGGGMDDRPWLSEIITSIRSHLPFLFVRDGGNQSGGEGGIGLAGRGGGVQR